MMSKFQQLLLSFLLSMLITLPGFANDIPPRPTKAINTFINGMVKKYHYNKTVLTDIMNKAQYNPKVIHWITHPFEKKPWDFYRSFFVRDDRVKGGAHYWETHQKLLAEIQKKYGVPPNIIIAIIGIESFYGERAGTYNELNALTTLSFYYPQRAKFFRSELTHYLLLTRHEKLNPLTLRGSYAGALGIPQFMPSSYRHYGVDYTNNQSINLFTNHADAIASVANYLKKAGWKPGKPVAVPAKVEQPVPKKLISDKAQLKLTLQQLAKYQIYPVKEEPKQAKVALIEMQNTNSKEYWIVFKNFRAIMRYNPSTTYTLAIFELSQAIKKAYEKNITRTSASTSSARKTA